MKAGDVMTTGAATVRAEAPLVDAARLMVEHQISGVPVVDAQDRLVGVLTEGDFLRPGEDGTPRLISMLAQAGPGANDPLRSRRVEEMMTRDTIAVSPEAAIAEVVALMNRHNVRRLPVVEGGKVVGIVSRGNLLGALFRRSMAPPRP